MATANGSGATLDGAVVAVDGRYLSRPGMGIHNYLVAGVQVLLERGATVTLLTNTAPAAATALPAGASLDVFGSRRAIRWEQVDLPRRLRQTAPALYWAPGNSGISLRRSAIPSVVTIHDLVPLRQPRQYLLRRPGFALPYVLWTAAALCRSDLVLTDSMSSARDIRRVSRRDARVVSPVLAASMLAPSSGPALPWPVDHLAHGTRYLLYTGGTDPRKRVPAMLAGFAEAARRDEELRLVLIGRGFDPITPLLEALGISHRVIRPGYVPDAAKWALINHARAVLYLSSYEGFGLPVVEAFSAGVPVVTCRNSSLAEIGADAAVFVESMSPRDIAAAIELCEDPAVRPLLVERGHQQLKRYLPDQGVHDLLAAFASVLRTSAVTSERPGQWNRR